MREQMVILADLKNGYVEIGFEDLTIAEVLPEYAQMLCDSYNNQLKEK